MENSLNVDVEIIGEWSSEDTKQLVRNSSNLLYQNKMHSKLCNEFYRVYNCYGCALEDYNTSNSFNLKKECKFFLKK